MLVVFPRRLRLGKKVGQGRSVCRITFTSVRRGSKYKTQWSKIEPFSLIVVGVQSQLRLLQGKYVHHTGLERVFPV